MKYENVLKKPNKALPLGKLFSSPLCYMASGFSIAIIFILIILKGIRVKSSQLKSLFQLLKDSLNGNTVKLAALKPFSC